MNQEVTPVTGTADGAPRTRRRRGSLSRAVILEAAEAVAQDGYESLSMRAFATRLGAVPMALYNHFRTKEEMVDALLDQVLSRFVAPPATDDWVDDLRRFAEAHRRVLADHPWAVAPLFSSPNPGMSSVRIGEEALRILRRGGVRGAQAVACFSGIVALNYGWASFTTAQPVGADGGPLDVQAALAALPRDAFPLTVEAAAHLGAYGSDAHYGFVLDRLLEGITATAKASSHTEA